MSRREDALVREWAWLASAIARDFFHPLVEPDDIRQEALISLMEAVRSYDADKQTTFQTFAALVIRNRIKDLLSGENRMKRRGNVEASRVIVTEHGTFDAVLFVEAPNADPHELLETRDEVRRIVRGFHQLSLLEQRAITEMLDGVPQNKLTDNACYRARNKLRYAA